MNKTLVIPYFNSLAQTKICWGINLAGGFFDMFDNVILIDNGDTDHTTEWIERYILTPEFPHLQQVIHNEENVGVLASLQQGYEATGDDTDWIFYMHNDVAMLDFKIYDFDIFHMNQEAGVIGLFGAKRAYPNGDRSKCVYRGLEAPLEGEKINTPTEVVLLDGLFLGIRKSILDKTNGWDMNYTYHHFYDKDICMESIKQGYKNYALPLSYYHLSGQTANMPSYQKWIGDKLDGGDQESHKKSEEYFIAKWRDMLPLSV
jgi:glycosyltransferase involved in cell wall biosynthesis